MSPAYSALPQLRGGPRRVDQPTIHGPTFGFARVGLHDEARPTVSRAAHRSGRRGRVGFDSATRCSRCVRCPCLLDRIRFGSAVSRTGSCRGPAACRIASGGYAGDGGGPITSGCRPGAALAVRQGRWVPWQYLPGDARPRCYSPARCWSTHRGESADDARVEHPVGAALDRPARARGSRRSADLSEGACAPCSASAPNQDAFVGVVPADP